MKTIRLDFAYHNGESIVLIQFPIDKELQRIVRTLPNTTWSRTFTAWRTPYSIEALHLIKKLFGPICTIDATQLKEKIQKDTHGVKNGFSPDTTAKITMFKDWMRSRRYSESTVKTYSDAITVFLKYFHAKPVHEITNEDVIQFNNEFILRNKLSSSYQNQIVNAVKLFFRTVENRAMREELVHRPKKEYVLPNVLSKDEVKEILSASTNQKHRTMLSLIYSCGLRRSELLNLKPSDIDSKRKIITIKAAKGKKDRIVPLSDKILVMLREYYLLYKPKTWLFEGQHENEPYNERSLASVLKQALAKTTIRKPVSLHWLRHSYATHLLEAGTDLRYIQEILGHKSSRTTEIYTHVSTNSIQKIKSPFDDMDI